MSVLRDKSRAGLTRPSSKNRAITIKCPKCQENISIIGFESNEAIRCARCAYPLILQDDLLQIVNACRELTSADQISSAVAILDKLTDLLPEAGTALGYLAKKYTLPLNDQERWKKLIGAYAGGDASAQEYLDEMCRSNPENYKRSNCRNCGARKYYDKYQRGNASCIYCLSME